MNWWSRCPRPKPTAPQPLRPRPKRNRNRLRLEELESRTLLSGNTLADAIPLTFTANQASAQGLLGGEADFYAVRVTEDGRLTGRVHADGFDTRLSLLAADGRVLVQSDGEAPDKPDDLIDLHLQGAAAGTAYYLRVEGLAGGSGSYTLMTQFAAALAPFQPLPVGDEPSTIVTGDFNADGILDLAAGNLLSKDISVLLGRGDGTFARAVQYGLDKKPYALVTGDFNGDGKPDLVSAHALSTTAAILLGQGDGTFGKATLFEVGLGMTALATADFDRDGKLDLAMGRAAGSVVILLGHGDGTFADQAAFAAEAGVAALAVGDFDGDGRADVAAANSTSDSVSVLLGRGDGTFADQAPRELANAPGSLAVGDFNRDGSLDLASADSAADQISVLLGLGDGTFQRLDQGGVEATDFSITTGDFNKDGCLDVAAANYSTDDVLVMLGRQDGPFQVHGHFAAGARPRAVIAGDFNGDGSLDLATANSGSDTVSLLLGRGDGTFAGPRPFAVGSEPMALACGDYDGDGPLDLAILNNFSNDISVLRGQGDGTFAGQLRYQVGSDPKALVAGDFNGDGRLDLITTNDDRTMSVLLGRGDGTFLSQSQYPTGYKQKTLIAADFNADGRLDLATTSHGSYAKISVFLGQGDGTFGAQQTFNVGAGSYRLAAMDIDYDGRLDLVAASYLAGTVSVYLGGGDGTFRAGASHVVGAGPTALVIGDFTGDACLDILTGNTGSSDVSLLLNPRDGTIQGQVRTAVGTGSVSLVRADFDGDGRPDLATADPYAATVSVRLGLNDGQFQDPLRFTAGTSPRALVPGDFNGDGRPDLAVADYLAGQVLVLLGFGDGTFRAPLSFAVGQFPTALATGDFNGDGRLDLAVVNYGSNDVSLLLGRGDGTFQAATRLEVGLAPSCLVVTDVTGDGRLDLAVGNYLSRDVSVLPGNGNGTFRAAARLVLSAGPASLAAGDFDNDGRLDLAAAQPGDRTVSLLLGLGEGRFQAPRLFTLTVAPTSLAAADFNNDGRLDLAASAGGSGEAVLALGDGSGDFRFLAPFVIGKYPQSLVASDFNGDGDPDLVSVNGLLTPLSVFLGKGDGTFESADIVARPLRFTPFVADFNGDGLDDVAVLRRDGSILVRTGRTATGLFRSPLIVNPEPGFAARDFTVLAAGGRYFLVTLEAHGDTLSTYTYAPGGTFARLGSFPVTASLPSRLVAGDLNGDALEDIALVAAGSSEVLIGLQRPDGTGFVAHRLQVGPSPSDIALLDIDGENGLDVVVTDQFAGDVRVFFNDPVAPFAAAGVYRSGVGLYAVRDWKGAPTLYSREAPVALAVGEADLLGDQDLIVVNSGSNSVTVLLDNGLGGLFNPDARHTLLTGSHPIAAVTGLFNADPYLDIIVLNAGSGDLSVFLGDARGGYIEQFTPGPDGQPARLAAGNLPGGLAAHDLNGDGQLDLLVGNENGDVLTLLGNGDGTFQPYQRLDRRTALAVADLNEDGQDDFIFANEAQDRVAVRYSNQAQPFTRGRQDGILNPGAVRLADLNGDDDLDLVVVSTGANEVLVYLGEGGLFDTAGRFFVGTSPEGVTVSDLNGDDIPDLAVANAGSNDVSILFGQGQGNRWTLIQGPRLSAGAGPKVVVVADVNGDSLPDLLVSNSESNTVSLLLGVGQGFFNDKNPTVFQTGADPEQLFVGHFDNDAGLDLVTVNAGSGDLSYFSGLGGGPDLASLPAGNFTGRSLDSGGVGPVAAVAGDFLQGHSGLIVLHSTDNRMSLLLAGSDGPQVAAWLTPGSLTNLSEVALGAVSGNTVEFYVTTEGEEFATRFSFTLDRAGDESSSETSGPSPLIDLLVPSLSAADALLQSPPGRQVADFSPLPDQPLGVVVTLLLSAPGEKELPPVISVSGEIPFAGPPLVVADQVGARSPDPAPTGPDHAPAGGVAFRGVGGDDFVDEGGAARADMADPSPYQATPSASAAAQLNAFITGADDAALARLLGEWGEETGPLPDAVVPGPEPFDFSDGPASVPPEAGPTPPAQGAMPEAPLPVEPDDGWRPAFWRSNPAEAGTPTSSPSGDAPEESVTGWAPEWLRGMTVLLAQCFVGPVSKGKSSRDEEEETR